MDATPVPRPTPISAPTGAQSVDQELMLKTAVLMLEGLSHFVLSGDVWAMSSHYAEKRAQDLGMDQDRAAQCRNQLLQLIGRNRSANPMSGMF